MRTGQNPSKTGIPAYEPHQLGIALLVYIPFMKGYFKHSLEILKYQIASLYEHTKQQFDLLVFDNGSCPEVVEVLGDLNDNSIIEWLVLSKNNLGKVGAWNWIFGSMPNEFICYADSDVFFRQGWLEASLEIIQAFPKVGMVSAQPTFHDVLEGGGKAHLLLSGDQYFEKGNYQPEDEIVKEYCLGIGADDDLSARFFDVKLPCITDLHSKTKAVIGATHMQFIIPSQVAREMVPFPVSKGLHRAETTSLDRKIDDLGYLHLSTQENYVMHMGNMINAKLLSEVQDMDGFLEINIAQEELVLSNKSGLFRLISRLLKIPSLNRFFLNVYDFLYRALYVEKQ
jgi:glycosyltransferase involved in cell wall biosynthesis